MLKLTLLLKCALIAIESVCAYHTVDSYMHTMYDSRLPRERHMIYVEITDNNKKKYIMKYVLATIMYEYINVFMIYFASIVNPRQQQNLSRIVFIK